MFRNLLLILFIGSSFLYCTQKQSAHAIILPRDTSITPEKAVTRLLIDSADLDSFLSREVSSRETAIKIRNFYYARNLQFAWFDEEGLSEPGEAFWSRYQRRLHLLRDSSNYSRELHERMESILNGDSTYTKAGSLENIELNLTLLFFDYLNSAINGKISPEDMQWHIPRRKLSAVEMIDSFLSSGGHNWEPLGNEFHLLRQKLFRYASIQHDGGWSYLDPDDFNQKAHSRYKSISQLKKRLNQSGEVSIKDTSDLFTPELENAIKVMQKSYGLKQNGKPTTDFIDALNVPVSKRINQILVNLERMKWMPVENGRSVIVNIPEFKLHAIDSVGKDLVMKIVVGKTATRTVIFSDELEFIVFNPYWNVPRSIVKNEILPAMNRSGNYLKRHNMEITGYDNGIPVIRQKPGPSNALGRIKFIFPNRYNIYLHDTPAKNLFEKRNRAFSHGCIRVSEPIKLAEFLLKSEPGWSKIEIENELRKKSEQWVRLSHPVPVYIVYFTSWVDSSGLLNFRNDIYGHDQRLSKHLIE